MWQEAKKKELWERKLIGDLYRDLIGQFHLNERSKKVVGSVAISFLKQY